MIPSPNLVLGGGWRQAQGLERLFELRSCFGGAVTCMVMVVALLAIGCTSLVLVGSREVGAEPFPNFGQQPFCHELQSKLVLFDCCNNHLGVLHVRRHKPKCCSTLPDCCEHDLPVSEKLRRGEAESIAIVAQRFDHNLPVTQPFPRHVLQRPTGLPHRCQHHLAVHAHLWGNGFQELPILLDGLDHHTAVLLQLRQHLQDDGGILLHCSCHQGFVPQQLGCGKLQRPAIQAHGLQHDLAIGTQLRR
mmetsp:Transcript_2271/g.5199  ORF Transcript_2271/g.5199 Transcript_2271/m.5199 type:complete len:247 (-) Transcript_2271:1001-1741(-)